MAKKTQTGSTIGDGFRFGIGLPIVNPFVTLLAAVLWRFALAGDFGVAAMNGG